MLKIRTNLEIEFPMRNLLSKLICASLFFAAIPSAYAWEQLPNFPLHEWQNRQTGPAQDGYNVQTVLYKMIVTAPAGLGEEKSQATLTILDPNAAVAFTSPVEIKTRGFTSLGFPKKQYSVTLLDAPDGDSKSKAVLDLPSGDEWVLAAPWDDKSLIRDLLAYNLANKLGHHAPRTRIATLSLQIGAAAPIEQGLYVLTEKNVIGKNRINIDKKDGNDTAYLANFDHYHDGDNDVWQGRNTEIILAYPKADKITQAQQDAFVTNINDIDARVSLARGQSWDAIFDEKLDLGSAVDFFIVQEMAKNIDGYRLSSTIYQAPRGKVNFGPVWDFNIAFGNANYNNGYIVEGWRAQEDGVWFGALMKHPQFCAALKQKWTTARANGDISNNTMFRIIDQHAAVMAPATAQNFDIWPSLGQQLWPNPYWLDTWEGELEALKSYASLRADWMDQAISRLTCN